MASIKQLMSGVLRYFPNVMLMALLVGGILLAKLPWIFTAAGGLVVAVVILIIQFLLGKVTGDTLTVPGINVMEMCSILPTARADKYMLLPSMWVAMTAFFCTYIVFNAASIYTTNPTAKPNDATPVQQRKGLGLISMLAAILLLVVLLVGRYVTGCELTNGTIFGILSFVVSAGLGVAIAYGWWSMLSASGTSNADVHGVMSGLTPGGLRAGALACKMS